jgi:hypothetical protein
VSQEQSDYRTRALAQITSGQSVRNTELDHDLLEQVRPYEETQSAMSVVKKEFFEE